MDVIVDDDGFELPVAPFLPGSDGIDLAAQVGLQPDFLDLARGVIKLAVQSFVVRVGGRTIVIDTCVGEHKARPEIQGWDRRDGTGFLGRLAATGIAPADVDVVFCTHLHVDHVGWNTRGVDGRWVPTFPSARYLFGRRELADWTARCATGAPSVHCRALADSVTPIVEAGLADLVDDGYEVAAGAVLLPLPGHTAGQMGLRLERGGEGAVFCGDAVHSPLQILDPTISTSSCADPAARAQTRQDLFAEAADGGRLLVPAHFRGPRCAHVRCTNGRFEPVFDCIPA